MKLSHVFSNVTAVFVCLFMWSGLAHAQTTTNTLFHVTINTTQLEQHDAGPFSLQFTLVDGSTSGDGNTTIVVTNFNFGTNGDYSGDADTDGGITGDLSSSVSLTDSASDNRFTEEFTAGNTLTFDVYASLSLDTNGITDEFDISILDSGGEPIPTVDTNEDNVMVRLTTSDGATINVESYNTDSSQDLFASGPPVSFGPLVLLDGVAPPGPPILKISNSGNDTATLLWPALYTSYSLEATSDFTNWNLVPLLSSVSGTNTTVIVYPGDAPYQFYRLSQ